MSDPAVGVSFSGDIAPLFRPTDVEHMRVFGVFLDKYEWMSQASNARNVYRHLTGQLQPQMPLGGPFWGQQQLDLLKRWIDEGYQP
jgi:hypothetical protein